jgi:hypothetical protein
MMISSSTLVTKMLLRANTEATVECATSLTGTIGGSMVITGFAFTTNMISIGEAEIAIKYTFSKRSHLKNNMIS